MQWHVCGVGVQEATNFMVLLGETRSATTRAEMRCVGECCKNAHTGNLNHSLALGFHSVRRTSDACKLRETSHAACVYEDELLLSCCGTADQTGDTARSVDRDQLPSTAKSVWSEPVTVHVTLRVHLWCVWRREQIRCSLIELWTYARTYCTPFTSTS